MIFVRLPFLHRHPSRCVELEVRLGVARNSNNGEDQLIIFLHLVHEQLATPSNL